MNISNLTQQITHSLLKPFLENRGEFPDWEKAFQDEARRRDGGKDIWALPEPDRQYYLVSIEQGADPYLLIGINPQLNISSLGKIGTAAQKMGASCFKYFFTIHLLPELRRKYPGRDILSAVASTLKGTEFFRRLQCDPPNGVKEVRIERMPSLDTNNINHISILLTQDDT